MNKLFFSFVFMASLLAAIVGCGPSPQEPPPQVMAPRTSTSTTPEKKTWSEQDKIDAINRAPISEDQKKAEIAKVKSGKL